PLRYPADARTGPSRNGPALARLPPRPHPSPRLDRGGLQRRGEPLPGRPAPRPRPPSPRLLGGPPRRRRGAVKVLLAYPVSASAAYGGVDAFQRGCAARLRASGFAVEGVSLTIAPPGPPLTCPELELPWRWGDHKLLAIYDRLLAAPP